MTVCEFERLGREPWTQSFRIRVGLLASSTSNSTEQGTKEGPQHTQARMRNTVGEYPCGILEQAYRELKGKAVEAVASRAAQPPVTTPKSHGAPMVEDFEGSESYLEAVLWLRLRNHLRQLLARVEHARLHGRLVNTNDFGNLVDRLAVVVSEVDDLAMVGR